MSAYYPLTTQTVAFLITSVASTNAVGAQTKRVRLVATTDCHIAFGVSPTATTSDMYLAADREEIFKIKPGQKVAAIRNTADGTLYVTEME